MNIHMCRERESDRGLRGISMKMHKLTGILVREFQKVVRRAGVRAFNAGVDDGPYWGKC